MSTNERTDEFDIRGINWEEMEELHKINGVYLEYKPEEGGKRTAYFLKDEKVSFLITKDNLILYRPLTRDDRRKLKQKKNTEKKKGRRKTLKHGFIGRSGNK